MGKMLAMAVHAAPQTSAQGARAQETVDASTLFRAHAPFVAAFLQRLGISAQDAGDLVQEVFLIVHRKGGYRPGAARPTTWLAGVALGVARNFRRRDARRSRIEEAVDVRLDAGGPDLEHALDARTSLDHVRRALDHIHEDQRVVIILHELEGESLVSIAAGLGVPKGTIYARLHRGRKAFRKAYAELTGEGSQP